MSPFPLLPIFKTFSFSPVVPPPRSVFKGDRVCTVDIINLDSSAPFLPQTNSTPSPVPTHRFMLALLVYAHFLANRDTLLTHEDSLFASQSLPSCMASHPPFLLGRIRSTREILLAAPVRLHQAILLGNRSSAGMLARLIATDPAPLMRAEQSAGGSVGLFLPGFPAHPRQPRENRIVPSVGEDYPPHRH
ncbi:hypothetical protein BO78DRAFT_208573 [Aspergillus sclerotiicarbonarius CBS 121057]|uniref:Uncharacterized protein n=1 Tax=Aspergillus sclerotiicarbonarius (strain CBS 121057 / IBT 28362) TaxID=1448318 RepID=A0A319DYT3_ASPSB|nr:hypothetical protein BO78DRAFT_208573 [Aspergillus sclerotiicarbonarius CBS 121057]